jgi:hypothetical protein
VQTNAPVLNGDRVLMHGRCHVASLAREHSDPIWARQNNGGTQSGTDTDDKLRCCFINVTGTDLHLAGVQGLNTGCRSHEIVDKAQASQSGTSTDSDRIDRPVAIDHPQRFPAAYRRCDREHRLRRL